MRFPSANLGLFASCVSDAFHQKTGPWSVTVSCFEVDNANQRACRLFAFTMSWPPNNTSLLIFTILFMIAWAVI